MITDRPVPSWLGELPPGSIIDPGNEDFALARLWAGFMNARIMIAVVLLLLQGSIYGLGQPVSEWMVGLCIAYLGATVGVRLIARPRLPGRTFDPQWAFTIGVDVIAFSALQLLQAGTINYTPLFAVPVLLASVLGSGLLALGTAAGVTLLLLADAWWMSLQSSVDAASKFLQSGLAGTGFFVVAFLTNQLASRLAREEQTARRSLLAARIQTQVNELVIETLANGVLVVDANGIVRAANPAARQLLDVNRAAPFVLAAESAWQPLVELARLTFVRREAQLAEVALAGTGQSERRFSVSTRLTAAQEGGGTDSLCVMFLQDLREMEARVRTEKLAAMGRMSAAVAHEIRNPLAAISQANALLDEDLTDPAHKQLTLMVTQNARRLARIVEEVLNISRVQDKLSGAQDASVNLGGAVRVICADWAHQTGSLEQVAVRVSDSPMPVEFEMDHLRRVLVNLLDNALRYADMSSHAIEIGTVFSASGQACLSVWSSGKPMEHTVQRHLFEPFFSSHSRSSGLGLYICRELCERHGAVIAYQRSTRDGTEGNEFFVTFRTAAQPSTTAAFDTMTG